jgi:hypothetical protein
MIPHKSENPSVWHLLGTFPPQTPPFLEAVVCTNEGEAG